jgi:2-polyprenyl-6-methoxyphenol hydroxylase-like FAD-dependent oxidoreductase
MTSKPHILIAGGGIGGMAAALALLFRRFDVDVYEQAAELKEVAVGIQISPNGNRALDSLGVCDRLSAMHCHPAPRICGCGIPDGLGTHSISAPRLCAGSVIPT